MTRVTRWPPFPRAYRPDELQTTFGIVSFPCGPVIPALVMYYPDDRLESVGKLVSEHVVRDEDGSVINFKIHLSLLNRTTVAVGLEVLDPVDSRPLLMHGAIADDAADQYAMMDELLSRVGMCLVTLVPLSSFDPDAPSLPLNDAYTWWSRSIEITDESRD